ncbi:MAG: hypothetical protein Q9174_003048, partial [Haloplaca sp. 1 TL-2023]
MATHTTPGNGQPLTARDLTMASLPDIVRSEQRTVSSSMNANVFVGRMAKWHDFEKEVRENFNRQQWQNARSTLGWSSDLINIDRVMCATEAGVTGRFLQHVGQVMSCVGQELRLPMCFGDWHGGTKHIPDVTIWKKTAAKPTARVAGELKAPWTCNLLEVMSDADSDDAADILSFESDFSAWAGQVANYMSKHKYKYGFLSTYQETVFFKQETFQLTGAWAKANDVANGEAVTVLYYSNAVHHYTAFGTPRNAQNPQDFRDKVTVRECMLYLMKVSESYPEPRVVKSWTRNEKTSSGTKTGKHLVPDPNDKNSPSKSSASQSSSSKGKAPQQHSYTTGNSLVQQMNGLNMKDQTDMERYMKYKPFQVRWSDKAGTYIWEKGGKKSKVDGHTRRLGILMVTINGE